MEEEKGRRGRKLWTHIPHEHRCKTVGKILANEALYKKIIHPDQVKLISGMQSKNKYNILLAYKDEKPHDHIH